MSSQTTMWTCIRHLRRDEAAAPLHALAAALARNNAVELNRTVAARRISSARADSVMSVRSS
jgi:hypothetical protein